MASRPGFACDENRLEYRLERDPRFLRRIEQLKGGLERSVIRRVAQRGSHLFG
jgi:hypothetical protein